ncbi:hypothetical protein BKA70DRAFT_1451444 [Coprinopsis sp. MPI-PUGE-AT-0042]|nr:hypothetical protein BKA70DRAFT_1451444 [Coprinopsis sp. MPI-PUGE-AT-0042]
MLNATLITEHLHSTVATKLFCNIRKVIQETLPPTTNTLSYYLSNNYLHHRYTYGQPQRRDEPQPTTCIGPLTTSAGRSPPQHPRGLRRVRGQCGGRRKRLGRLGEEEHGPHPCLAFAHSEIDELQPDITYDIARAVRDLRDDDQTAYIQQGLGLILDNLLRWRKITNEVENANARAPP